MIHNPSKPLRFLTFFAEQQRPNQNLSRTTEQDSAFDNPLASFPKMHEAILYAALFLPRTRFNLVQLSLLAFEQ
jgi:hypothetical protein